MTAPPTAWCGGSWANLDPMILSSSYRDRPSAELRWQRRVPGGFAVSGG